jgi:alpha-aminoadipate/glutamate carrier protein LysW
LQNLSGSRYNPESIAIARHAIEELETRPQPPGACMATCPECDAEIEVDEFDVDKGDLISCPDCGANLEVTSTSPVELEAADDEDEEDDDRDDDEDEEEDELDDEDDVDDLDDDTDKEDWDE